MMMENFIENYQQQVDERAALGVVLSHFLRNKRLNWLNY